MPRKTVFARFYSFILVDVDVGLLLVVSVVVVVVVVVSVAALWSSSDRLYSGVY